MSSVHTSPPGPAFSSGANAGPLPAFPKETEIPVFKTTTKQLPDIPIPAEKARAWRF